MIKIRLGTARKFVAIFANLSLLLNSFVPFLLAVPAAYAQEATPTETAVVESQPEVDQPLTETPTPEVPAIIEVTPTPEIIPTPEITPIVEITPSPENTPTPEVTPSIEPINVEIGVLTPSVEATISSEINSEPVESTPEPITAPDTNSPEIQNPTPEISTTPTPTEAPILGTVFEKVCLTDEQIKDTTNEEWIIDDINGISETKSKVQLGVKYIYPQENKVSVIFKCLPKDESLRTSLKIQKIKTADLALPDTMGSVGEYAYDITTGMKDGDFEYDVTLPKPENSTAEISYIEKSVDEAKSNLTFFDINKINSNVEQSGDTVKATGVDHFTIYVVSYADNAYIEVDDNFYPGETVFAKGNSNQKGVRRLVFVDKDGVRVNECPSVYGKETTCSYNLSNSPKIGEWNILLEEWLGFWWLVGEHNFNVSNISTATLSGSITATGNCMADAAGVSSFQCTANDVSIANVTGVTILDDGCQSPDDTVSFSATWNVQATASKRYDVGLYFATDGQTNAQNGNCSVTTLANSPIPPWFNYDGDFCGDINADSSVNPQITMTVKCLDPDGNNFLNIPYCTSWDNNSNTACNSVQQAIPGTGSKCNCEAGFEVGITVPYSAQIEVIKDLIPSTNLGRFNLQIDSVNKKENAGDNDTTGKITVGAGTNANSGDTHDVGEVAYTGTNLSDYTSSISCVDRGLSTFNGGTALTISSAGPINVSVDKDDDIVCTITNTRNNYCGDGVVNQSSEKCDDGNNINGDGCNSTCQWENGTLLVKKHVINDNGGLKIASDFTLNIGSTMFNGSEIGTSFTLPAGVYSVGETLLPGYTQTSNECSNINLIAGESKTCTITNDDIAPSLTLNKILIKDNGSTALESAWTLTANGGSSGTLSGHGASGSADVVSGSSFKTGTYTLSESGPSGYTASSWTCTNGIIVNGNSEITLGLGKSTVCSITNNDIQPKLTVTKIVVGDSRTASDFTLKVGATIVTSGIQNGFNAASYIVSETSNYLPDYNSVIGGECASNGAITLAPGDVKSCTITNTRKTGTLRVLKNVDLNGDGDYTDAGETGATDWQWQTRWTGDLPEYAHSGYTGDSATTVVNGNHFISETPKENFHQVSISCVGDLYEGDSASGHTVGIGENTNVVCTFVNARDTGTIELMKSWSGNGGQTTLKIGTISGGSDIDSQQTGANGSIPLSTGQNNVITGTYYLSETNGLTNYTAAPLSCFNDVNNNGTNDTEPVISVGANDSVSVARDQHIICTYTNTRDTGNLKVQKTVDDYSDLTQWIFTLDNGTSARADSNGLVDFGQVTTGVDHYISESGPSDYHYVTVTGTNCNPYHSGWGIATVNKNETTTCTFSNAINKGSLTIIKDALPNDPQDFSFTTTGSGLSNFSLDDDSDTTLSNTKVFSNLFPGTYSVSENDVAGWDKTSAVCSDGSPINAIVISPDEDVTCTFTNTKRASITAHKFKDNNTNGTQNDTEPNLSGWNMKLYSGSDCQGTHLSTANTDSNGNVLFSNIIPGDYSVSEYLTSDYKNSTPICQNVNVAAGESKQLNFGNFILGQINICKYNDQNGDGLYSGDPMMSGWTINLTGPNGYSESKVTDEGGCVGFSGLLYGSYTFSEVQQTGWVETIPVGGRNYITTIDATTFLRNLKITNFKYGSIFGQKFNDLDGDGIKDAGENGLANWTINLDKDADGSVDSTTVTDVNGNYKFENLTSDIYRIREVQKTGWAQTSINPTDKTIISESIFNDVDFGNRQSGKIIIEKQTTPNNDTTTQFEFDPSYTSNFYLKNMETNDSGFLNPGNYTVTELGERGWDMSNLSCNDPDQGTTINRTTANIDLDSGEEIRCVYDNTKRGSITIIKNTIGGNGTFNFDSGKLPVPGFVISTSSNVGSTTFSDLQPGSYDVYEQVPTGWDLTDLTCVDPDDESDINLLKAYTDIDLDAGENITCTFTNTKLGSIQGKKFEDKNANGAWNSGDTYLNDWTINLYQKGEGWDFVGTKVTGHTGTLGQYRFENLYPGEYLVCENIKTGWDQTYPISGQLYKGSVCHTVNLTAGQNVTGLLFGNFELGKIQGKKYNDVDGDGNPYESGEEYLNGWTIRLYKNWEEPIEITTSNTGILGQYQYTNLLPGTYQICEVLEEKWAQTWPKIGNVPVEDNGTSHSNYGIAVANQSGEEDEGSVCWQTTIDSSGEFNQLLKFGNVKLNDIHGYKWDDKNGNAVEDSDESRLSGWEIFIDENDDSIWNEGELKTITSSDPNPDHFGWYWFENLFPETYKICEVPQTGWLQTYPTPACHTVSLPYSSQEIERSVLNYIEDPAPAYNFGNLKLSKINVTKFNDRNGNKTKDEGEETLPGWDITLTSQANQTTDQNGQATFDKLIPSTYYLDEVLKEGWIQTTIYCDDQNQEPTITPTPGERQEVFNRIFGVKTVNAQTAPTGYEINLTAGQNIQCYIGNKQNQPKLTISKTNNRWPTAQTNGSEVEYTITLNVQENNVKGVSVIDLPPYGFTYKAGSWKVLVNGNPINIPEPVYSSPGKWQIGDLNKNDVVTLKYIATIDNSVDSGTYKDAAWAYGCQDSQECTLESSDKLLASAVAPGYLTSTFVGTQIKIDPVFASQDVNIVKEEGQVLGATTEMPGTGAQTIWMIIFGLLSLIGLGFIIYGLKKEKNIMKSLIIIALISLASLFPVKTVNAVQSSNIFISVENPISPTNKDKFTLSFTTLDILNRPLTVKCFKINPDSSETQIGTVDIKAGGNSGECNLDNNPLTESEKTYYFYATASSGGEEYRSDSVPVDYDSSGPGTPNDYSKEREGCNYKISFKASNDGKTNIIRIYRADVTKFIADAGSQIGQVGISPDQKGSFTDVNVPDCNKTYYYVIRAFDEAGNGSGLAGDSITVFISTTTPTTTTGSVLGAIPLIGNNNIPKESEIDKEEGSSDEKQEGSILGTEIPTNPKSISAQFQSFISRHKISSALIALLVLFIIGYVVKKVRKKRI